MSLDLARIAELLRKLGVLGIVLDIAEIISIGSTVSAVHELLIHISRIKEVSLVCHMKTPLNIWQLLRIYDLVMILLHTRLA
jgi:hypothetical protein